MQKCAYPRFRVDWPCVQLLPTTGLTGTENDAHPLNNCCSFPLPTCSADTHYYILASAFNIEKKNANANCSIKNLLLTVLFTKVSFLYP